MHFSIIVLVLCFSLTKATNIKIFYGINEEWPQRQVNRTPKILTSGNDSIPIVVNKMIDEEQFSISPSDLVESVPLTIVGQPMTRAAEEAQVNTNILSRILYEYQQYQPVLVLVEDNLVSLQRARTYLSLLFMKPSLNNPFWLMKFNASGVSSVLARIPDARLRDKYTENFFQQLDNRADTRQELGSVEQVNDGVVVFFSILKATRVLNPGAAILLFADSQILDVDLAKLAIKEAMQRRIRVLVLWHERGLRGPRWDEQSDALGEIAFATGGVFIVMTTLAHPGGEKVHMTINGNVHPVIAHLSHIVGHRDVHVPIEDGVTAIHISLSTTVHQARFYTPQDYLIDVLNVSDVRRFTHDSYVLRTGDTFEIELVMQRRDAAAAHIGIWHLVTDGDAQRVYNVIVSVRHEVHVRRAFTKRNDRHRNHTEPVDNQHYDDHVLHLSVQGDYAKIDDVRVINSTGDEIGQSVKYSVKANNRSADDIETIAAGSDIAIDVESLPAGPAYIQLRGKDKAGNTFQRLSYYDPHNIHNALQPTSIRLAEGSELYQIPGRVSNILFEVTNNRDTVVFMRFMVRDERAYLQRMFPLWAWINPRQTVIVTLTTISKGGTDLVTFTGYSGSDRFAKNVIIRSERSGLVYDVESPHMWHRFTSNCLDVIFGHCKDYTWTMHVTAQDRETGLLLLASSPPGLFFPNGYTSGTTEEVTGVLSGSCCAPNIVLTAVDAVNNRRSYVANAFWATLGVGAIVAIVLGALILLALISLCIYCCVRRRKQRGSLDLPPVQLKYRGPANSASTPRY